MLVRYDLYCVDFHETPNKSATLWLRSLELNFTEIGQELLAVSVQTLSESWIKRCCHSASVHRTHDCSMKFWKNHLYLHRTLQVSNPITNLFADPTLQTDRRMGPTHKVFLFSAFAKLRKATVSIVMSVCPSARPSVCKSVCNNSASVGRILIKFDTWAFCENLYRKFKFN
jgi:hypothetical protein